MGWKESFEEKQTLLNVNPESPLLMLLRTRPVRETVRKHCWPDYHFCLNSLPWKEYYYYYYFRKKSKPPKPKTWEFIHWEVWYIFLKISKCSKLSGQQCTPARNNRIGLWLFFCCFFTTIKSNGWGYSYCASWPGILGPEKDELKQEHLPRMFSSIKNKSWRLVANSLSSGVDPIILCAVLRTPKFLVGG